MAGVEAIVPATTAATPYDFSNTTAAPKSVFLTPAAGKELMPGMYVRVLRKKYGTSSYYEVFRLTHNQPSYVCYGNSDFRLDRPAQEYACGADVQYD